MSYSFNFTEPTKATAKLRIAHEFAKVIVGQPIHAADCHIAQAAACAMIDGLAEDKPVSGSISGSVSAKDWATTYPSPYGLQHSINVYQA
jgi:hypothetical protein